MMNATSKTWPLPRSIHPPAYKAQSLREPIRTLPLPERLVIALTQPGYTPPELFVKVGERVLKGQLLARGTSALNLACHASSSGTVVAIEALPVPNASGIPELCAVIVPDGCDEWLKLPSLDPISVDTDALLERIGDAGISGLGGAGFPTQTKLRGAPQRTHTLVINAAECEPFISADDALLREHAESVVAGIAIVLRLTTPERCLIGIEDDKPQAIAALRSALAALGDARITLVVIPTHYPCGAEKQLIYMLTGIEIASGTYPIEHGILCQNVGTCHAITRAVFHGEALVSRIVTITGAALRRPGNVEALIGTPLSALLEACELDPSQLSRLIHGGPLMGLQLPHAELPLLKISNCCIATTAAELPPPPPAQACIRCGLCADACPVLLLPQQLYWFSRAKELDKAERHNLIDCIECGACAYVCPSNIPLVQYFRAAKGELFDAHDKHRMAEHSKQRFDFHQARKLEEKAQEERRRQERAALVKQKQDAPGAPTEDAIAAALARVQAKKATQQVETPQLSPQEVIQAALARVNAKKAERKAAEEQQATSTPATSPDENDKP
jgi:electron transport complex protein RnfC